jgi:hypothetical protein
MTMSVAVCTLLVIGPPYYCEVIVSWTIDERTVRLPAEFT